MVKLDNINKIKFKLPSGQSLGLFVCIAKRGTWLGILKEKILGMIKMIR